jgi:pyrophosphatase PpaX
VRFPVVLFDFDGTLVDSGPMILASMRYAATTVLGREVTEADTGALLAYAGGWTLREQMRHLDEELADELVRVYREHNEPLHGDLQVFPGVEAMLEELRSEGRRLGIVTAKRHATVELAFARWPLRDFFEVVVTSENTERHKPDPDPILHALEVLRSGSGDAVYVGDSPFDVAAAKAAGVFAVAVAWGGMHPLERVIAAEPDAVVESAEELLVVL